MIIKTYLVNIIKSLEKLFWKINSKQILEVCKKINFKIKIYNKIFLIEMLLLKYKHQIFMDKKNLIIIKLKIL